VGEKRRNCTYCVGRGPREFDMPKPCQKCGKSFAGPGLYCSTECKTAAKDPRQSEAQPTQIQTEAKPSPSGQDTTKQILVNAGWKAGRVSPGASNFYFPQEENVHPHLHLVVDFSGDEPLGQLKFLALTQGPFKRFPALTLCTSGHYEKGSLQRFDSMYRGEDPTMVTAAENVLAMYHVDTTVQAK
jgi:hypothetical protein